MAVGALCVGIGNLTIRQYVTNHQVNHFELRGVARLALLAPLLPQVKHLRIAHDLHAPVGEVAREPAQR